MVFVVLGSVLANLAFYLYLIFGWINLPKRGIKRNLTFSIIVPVRNEALTIQQLLICLLNQDYPKDQYEIIVVDDFSTDDTAEKVNALMEKEAINIKLYSLKVEDGTGKKRAITRGVQAASFEHIITTDADCTMQELWLASYATHFGENMIMTGPVSMIGSGIFTKMQQIEFAGLIGFGAVTIQNDDPSMCSGANLGFVKQAFNEVGGYSDNIEIPSGDDEFLLYNIQRRFPGKAQFMKDRNGMVQTPAHKTISSFFNQRKRWTSKWRHNRNGRLRLSAILFFIDQLIFMIVGSMSAFGSLHYGLFFFLLGLKVILSGFYMNMVNRFMGNSYSFFGPLLFQIIYPFHVLLMGLNSIFGSYTWKGRKYKLD